MIDERDKKALIGIAILLTMAIAIGAVTVAMMIAKCI